MALVSNPPNPVASRKSKAALISVVSNTSLVLSKLAIGIFTGSVSVISEAAHSAVDLLAALIAYCAVKTSDKSPDEKHPFGHGKIENVSGAVEAVLIVVAAIWIIFEAGKKIFSPARPDNLEFGMAIMLVSIIVNIIVSRYLFQVARETQSHALEADALHLQADIWTSVGVLAGLAAIKLTGLYWLDPLIAMLVALIIFKAGFTMTKKSLDELLDIGLPLEDHRKIEKVFHDHAEVLGYEDLKTRRSGSTRFIEAAVLLDENLTLRQAHALCDALEIEFEKLFVPCKVLLHPSPLAMDQHHKVQTTSDSGSK